MKLLNFNLGGRPRSIDDYQILQNLAIIPLAKLLSGKGNFIISGCQVTDTDISAGYIMLDGKVCSFEGAEGVTFPTYFALEETEEDFDLHEDGGSKSTTLQRVAVLTDTSTGSTLQINDTGARSWYDALAGEFIRMKGNQTIEGVKTFSQKVYANGMDLWQEITKLKARKIITSGGALTGGGDLTADRTLTVKSQGVTNEMIQDDQLTGDKINPDVEGGKSILMGNGSENDANNMTSPGIYTLNDQYSYGEIGNHNSPDLYNDHIIIVSVDPLYIKQLSTQLSEYGLPGEAGRRFLRYKNLETGVWADWALI